jgi:hypothetical protein
MVASRPHWQLHASRIPGEDTMAEIHSPQATASDIRRGYDDPPTNVKGFVIFLICFVLFAAGVNTLIWVMLGAMERIEQTSNVETYGAPPIAYTRQQSFPEPQLQPSPGHLTMDWKDMEDLKQADEATLRATTRPAYTFARDNKVTPLRIPESLVAAVGTVIEGLRNAPPTTMPAGSGAGGETQTGATPGAAPSGTTPQQGVTEPSAGQPAAPPAGGEPPKAPAGEEKPREAPTTPGNGEAK